MSVLHNDRGQHYSQVFTNAVAVDISTTDFIPTDPSQLYVGATGNIKVDTIESTGVKFESVPVGFFPVMVTKVYKTDTTASKMVAVR